MGQRMTSRLVDIVVGARPNFMKASALFAVANDFPNLCLRLIHTGQHYDANMSNVFLEDLGLPDPICNLEVGSDTHTKQTAAIMIGYEAWIETHRPNMCLVVGDVNSTVACALVAAKSGLPIGHVEAGLRSGDRTMPEEINRIVTDSLSDMLFATEPSGVANLAHDGHDLARIHLVGNVMIDTLFRMRPKAIGLNMHDQFGCDTGNYAYLTLHRPSNVDDPQILAFICEQVMWLAESLPVIFPVHPRTQARLEASGLHEQLAEHPTIHMTEPLGYLESLSCVEHARLVVTDSGGLQEETTALGIPCLTLRMNTERPVTCTDGTNTLIGHDWELFRSRVIDISREYEQGHTRARLPVPYWDGHAASRILHIVDAY